MSDTAIPAPEYDPAHPVDVLGDPTDYASMPDLQLLALFQGAGDLDAFIEIERRHKAGLFD